MRTTLSIMTSAILLSSVALNAETISLQKGWNLVGISGTPISGSSIPFSSISGDISDIFTFEYKTGRDGSVSLTPSGTSDVKTDGIKPGLAYWIKSDAEKSIELGTSGTASLKEMKAGWNLSTVGIAYSLINFQNKLTESALKLDDIFTFEYKTGRDGSVALTASGTSDIETSGLKISQGYWIKVKKLSLRAKTADGVYLDFYADDTSDTLANGLKDKIAALDYANITTLDSSNFTNFSGEVVVATADQYTDEISEKSHDLVSVSSSGISGTLPDSSDVLNDTTTISNVVLYSYAIKEGGSPTIVSSATLYRIDADGSETELGTSDSNGLLVPSEDIRGSKVILRATGLADVTMNLASDYNKPSYYAIMPSGSSEELTEEATTPASSGRLLSRTTKLDREISRYRRIKSLVVFHMNQVSVEMGTRKKFTITQNSVPDKTSLETAIEESGFTPTIITALDVTLKKRFTHKTLNSSTTTFDDLYYSASEGSYSSDIDAFYIGLVGKKSDYNYGSIDANSIYSDQDDTTKGKVEVYMYKDNTWEKLNSTSAILKTADLNSANSEEKNIKKRLKKSDFYIKLNSVGIDTSKDYNGYYPLAIVYKQSSVTQKDFIVTVKDATSSEVIPNALVRLGATNYVTDTTGKVTLSVTVTGDGSLIPLSVSEPKHLRVATSVDPLTLTNDSSDNQIIQLNPIPNSATITGTVIDKGTKDGISNTEVTIRNPISLDIIQATTKDGIRGIELGLDASATYTWYIKEATPATTASARRLGRVSATSWTQVKEDIGKQGNFLSYNEIIKTLLKPTIGTGESDAISGLFDIAVKVAHDVDGDGVADYVELATNGSDTILNESDSGTSDVTTGVSSDYVADYAKTIGQLKIALDANKVAKASSGVEDSGNVIFITDSNKYWQDTSSSSFEDKDGDESQESTYANYDLAIGGGSAERPFKIDGFSTDFVGENAKLDWKVAIIADIRNSSGVVSSVMLGSDMQWKALNSAKNTYEDLSEIEQGEILADNANFSVGSLEYKDGNLVSADSTISYKRLMRSLANDGLIKALNKSIADIAAEAGVSTDGVSDTSIKMLKDGISVELVADMRYVRDPDGANESVRAILHTDGLTLKAEEVKDLLTVTDAPLSPLAQVEGEISTYSDRVGEFRFTRVPYDFGKLNESESLMRLGADRFDYFSNNVNIGAFEPLESALTTVSQNIEIQAKKTYSVTLDIGDYLTKFGDVEGATVIISGQKSTFGELATYTIDTTGKLGRLIPGTSGITPTFGDILEGYQTVFIYKDGYKAVKKSLNLSADQTVTVKWETVADPADYTAVIDIDYDNSTVNYETGKAILSGLVYDKGAESPSLSKDAKINLMINGEVSTKRVSVDTEGRFSVSFDLPKGESDAKIVVVNDKGIAISSEISYNYNPDFGSFKGSVTGLATDEYAIVSVFNSDNDPVADTVPDSDGSYNLISLPVGKYKITATAFDLAGNDYSSNTIAAEVVGGKIISLGDLEISHDSTAISGAPAIEFTSDDVDVSGSTDATVNLTATVNNFELGDDVETRFALVLNDVQYPVTKSNFTATTTKNNYTFTYAIKIENLQSGQNVVYLAGINKNGKSDFSADLYITQAAGTEISLKNIEFMNKDNNRSIQDDYVYMDLYTYSGEFKGHYLSDYNETDNFITLGSMETGKYIADIYTQNENYTGLTTLVDVNSSGIYTRTGAELPDADSDNMYEIALRSQSDVVNTPPELALPRDVIEMDSSDSAYTIYDIASDADGDELTLSLGDYNVSLFTAEISGNNLVVTPISNAEGSSSISVSVSDGTDSVTSSVDVSITTYVAPNYEPSILSDDSLSLNLGDYTSDIIYLFDPENDSLTVNITGYDDSIVSVEYDDDATITVTALSGGETTINLSVDDGTNAAVTKTIDVTVSGSVDIPTPPERPTDPEETTTDSEETATLTEPPSIPAL